MSGIEVVMGLATVISAVSSAVNVGDKSHKIYKWYKKKQQKKEMDKWEFDDVEDDFTVIKKKDN